MKQDEDKSTEVRARVEETPTQDQIFLLKVQEGPDVGKQFTLDPNGPGRTLIGKSPACEMRLVDPTVSRRHVAFEFGERGLRLNDMESRNGTFVNGLRVVDGFLRGGETLIIGSTRITVEVAGAAPMSIPSVMRFGKLLGASLEMRRLYPLCEKLARTDIPVTIEGETGTGKEVLAEALHEASTRAQNAFVVFDCTAVPPNLMESALFGHERGAFTGAVAPRIGVFEEADGGTLLIDEIGELDVSLQPKLLRALERSEVQRVGSNIWKKVNVRVLSATRRDLDREVQEGRFRDDLFYRLAVGRIELPPLRKRRGDVALLTRHFWRNLGGGNKPVPDSLLARFEDYAWPGNVRELYNAVARYLAVGDLDLERDVPSGGGGGDDTAAAGAIAANDSIEAILKKDLPLPRARQEVVEDFERRYVQRVLERYGGNVARAAAASGIARRYFQIIKAKRKT